MSVGFKVYSHFFVCFILLNVVLSLCVSCCIRALCNEERMKAEIKSLRLKMTNSSVISPSQTASSELRGHVVLFKDFIWLLLVVIWSRLCGGQDFTCVGGRPEHACPSPSHRRLSGRTPCFRAAGPAPGRGSAAGGRGSVWGGCGGRTLTCWGARSAGSPEDSSPGGRACCRGRWSRAGGWRTSSPPESRRPGEGTRSLLRPRCRRRRPPPPPPRRLGRCQPWSWGRCRRRSGLEGWPWGTGSSPGLPPRLPRGRRWIQRDRLHTERSRLQLQGEKREEELYKVILKYWFFNVSQDIYFINCCFWYLRLLFLIVFSMNRWLCFINCPKMVKNVPDDVVKCFVFPHRDIYFTVIYRKEIRKYSGWNLRIVFSSETWCGCSFSRMKPENDHS